MIRMYHVKSICEIANYRAGTIFAVVPHRKFWATVETYLRIPGAQMASG